jgi:hypothetical protein
MFVIVSVFIVAVVGAMIYAISTNPLVKELGRLAYLAAMIGLMVAGSMGVHEAFVKVTR